MIRRGRRAPIWTRWCISLGALLMLASGGILVTERVLITTATGAIKQQNLLGTAAGGGQRHADVKGAKNILLIGLDTRPSWAGTDQLSRSDSIILLHIPADHSSAYLISLPRDSYVAIPAYDNGKVPYRGGHDKINAAFAYGSRGLSGAAAESHGSELLALTIKQLTGITPDAAAIIDFSGFTRVLQIMGSVCMYVDETVTSIHVGHDRNGNQAVPYKTNSAGQNPRPVPGVTPNVYRKGNHCFTPTEALDYARQRDLLADGDGDYGRQRHQQQLLKAIFTGAVHQGLTSPAKLPTLLSAIGKTMTVDDGGTSLADWAFAMRGITPSRLVTLKTNDGRFDSRTIPGVGSAEILSPTSMQMIRAARDDTLAAFVQAHPSWQSQS
ncbi:LCP family protein [Actinoplanes sp. CA-030573]|uniref:LCP family protein n=1 Tax=Actinoplanes sp. CA-030573 TaxID=3239898 RepID=UPI003D905366